MRDCLRSVADGDNAAFSRLYDHFVSRVYRYLRVRVNEDGDVQDLMQSVFFAVWEKAASYEGKSTVATWILGIARHKMLDCLRTKQRELVVNGRDLDDLDAWDGAAQPDFSEAVVSDLFMSRLLAGLPPLYAELVYLVFVEALSYREIGAILDIPEGTVKSRMHQAKRLLKSQWIEGGMPDGRDV